MTHENHNHHHDTTQSSAIPQISGQSGIVPTAPGRRWRHRNPFILMGLVMVVFGGGIPYGRQLWTYYRTHESTDDAYVVGDIVPVSAHVSERVLSVYVDDNQRVEVGQHLAQLDPRDFETRVQQAKAALAVAQGNLNRAELEVGLERQSTHSDAARTRAALRAAQSAEQEARHAADEARARLRTQAAAVAAARAEVDVQQARLDMARSNFERIQQLMADGVIALQQLDEAKGALHTAQARIRASRQKLLQAQREVERIQVELRTRRQAIERAAARVAEAGAVLEGTRASRQNVAIKQVQVRVARAQVEQKEADLAYAESQLADTVLRAPTAGVITKKRLEVGQMVQAGQTLLAIVPSHPIWVEANFKETQLQGMFPGQPATLQVDAYPGQAFHGTVDSISPGTGSVFSLLPPENATGNFIKVVQRIPVKIALNAASMNGSVLRPGMSVNVTIGTR